jgi:hypothetical protein
MCTPANYVREFGAIAWSVRLLLPFLALLSAAGGRGPAGEGAPLSSSEVEGVMRNRHGALWLPVVDLIVPWYVTGDFNGDGALDVVAVVRVNQDEVIRHIAVERTWVPPGILVFKPLGTGMSRRRYGDGSIGPMRLLKGYSGAPLLLIMHSVRPGKAVRIGVKDYAVIDFCGSGFAQISVRRGALKPASAGDSGVLPSPRRLGDAIQGSMRGGDSCALYWDGTGYRWHPVE